MVSVLYELTDADTGLKTALQDRRRNQLPSTFGDDGIFEPQLITTDDVSERLMELAHFEQLSDILDIIEKHLSP
ncbi:hypothetical protein H4582DRAFT_2082837 [Lactarius indigo]|nr:hypothetical protein H4582DRAFT_2082837 [Lactarius indigo]